jgi:hypothetical protein
VVLLELMHQLCCCYCVSVYSGATRISNKKHGPSATRSSSGEHYTVDATTMEAAPEYTAATMDDGTTQPVDAATTIPRSVDAAFTIPWSMDAACPSDSGSTT